MNDTKNNPPDATKFNFFDVLNGLVDGGTWAAMTGPERTLAVCYLRHANQRGIAWPGNELLEVETGMGQRNVRRTRTQLVKRGVLIVQVAGGGRGNQNKCQIACPQTRTRCAPFISPINPDVKKPQTRTQSDTKPGRGTSENPDVVRPQKDKGTANERPMKDSGCADPTKLFAEEEPVVVTETPVDPKPAKAVKTKPTKASAETTGAHKAVVAYWCESSERANGTPYRFLGGRDGKLIKTVLEVVEGDEVRAKNLIDTYFAASDNFVSTQRYPLGLLVSQINRWVADAEGKPVANAKAKRVPEPWEAPTDDSPLEPEVEAKFWAEVEEAKNSPEGKKWAEYENRGKTVLPVQEIE